MNGIARSDTLGASSLVSNQTNPMSMVSQSVPNSVQEMLKNLLVRDIVRYFYLTIAINHPIWK